MEQRMPRRQLRMTAIILQLARLLADGPSKFEASGRFRFRDGWQTRVTVSDQARRRGIVAFRSALSAAIRMIGMVGAGPCLLPGVFLGCAFAKSITAEWIDNVLAREIETAMIAARTSATRIIRRGFAGALQAAGVFYDGMAGYFGSILGAVRQVKPPFGTSGVSQP